MTGTSASIPHTPSGIRDDLRALGIGTGDTLMLHASYRAVGPVMGGPNTIVAALQDVLGSDGTLMMYVGWNDIPDFIDALSDDEQAAYLAQHPPFDARTARAVRDHGILAECLRTWPGAHRSLNPEASMSAVGSRAEWLTRDHPLDYGYGAGSPLDRLVACGGRVLMLGAPLDTLTLLHHAEFHARLRHKRIVRYRCPIVRDGETAWVEIEDFDTGESHDDYAFDTIAQAALAAGEGHRGKVGHAPCAVFEASGLLQFAIRWLEMRFGS